MNFVFAGGFPAIQGPCLLFMILLPRMARMKRLQELSEVHASTPETNSQLSVLPDFEHSISRKGRPLNVPRAVSRFQRPGAPTPAPPPRGGARPPAPRRRCTRPTPQGKSVVKSLGQKTGGVKHLGRRFTKKSRGFKEQANGLRIIKGMV